MRSSMKIAGDCDLCESNALCEALAPDVFELDDDDYLVVKKEDIGPEDPDELGLAPPRRGVTATHAFGG
jgi:ferredoxin